MYWYKCIIAKELTENILYIGSRIYCYRKDILFLINLYINEKLQN